VGKQRRMIGAKQVVDASPEQKQDFGFRIQEGKEFIHGGRNGVFVGS
jgi:hypothetical protein